MASTTDWKTLFAQLQAQAKVPFAQSQSLDGNSGAFRAMYLDLGEIAAAVNAAPSPPALLEIDADVLAIPAGFAWPVSGTAAVIRARRIEAGADAKIEIDFRGGAQSSLILYFSEIGGSIEVLGVTASGSTPWTSTISAPSAPGGLLIGLQGGAVAATALTWAQGLPMQATQTVTDYLSTEFIFASLLFDQQPELALSMFTWVKDWTAASPAMLGDFLRSASMVALLSQEIDASANGAAFVPFLTGKIYTDLASAYAAQAKDYETKYLALSTQSVLTENDIALAKTLLADQAAQSSYVTQLLAQAKSNYDNASQAVTVAQSRFAAAKTQVDLTKIDFEERGVPEWKREQIAKAVFDLAMAVVTFGAGIAAMFAGDEAGGGAAVDGAVEGAKAAEAAAETGSAIAATASKLKEIMATLKKIAEALEKLYTFSQKIVEIAQQIGSAESKAAALAAMDVSTGGVDLTATSSWQVYQLNADDALAGPVSDGIEFADDLKLAIDTVAIYGQGLAAAQVAAIQAGQRFARVQLQLALAQEQQQNLQQYVDALTAGEQATAGMMQLFYRRYLDFKSGLFAAAQDYRASYFYWALQQSTVRPSIVDPVADMQAGLDTLTSMTLDDVAFLQHFQMPPQTMSQQLVHITDPAVLESFRTTKSASWPITLDEPAFAGEDRVRLSRVRIWLENTSAGEDYSVELMIKTSGSYQDRFEGLPFQFVAQPLKRGFKYEVTAHPQGGADWTFSSGLSGKVEVDGSLDQLVNYAYFQPTPFTQWTVTLAAGPANLDLSGLTRITMEFAGSTIPTGEDSAVAGSAAMPAQAGGSN